MAFRIRGVVSPKIGFASHQNAVPVLQELEIVNESPDLIEDLELSISADPPFIEAHSWRIDRLNPGSALSISDRNLKLNGTFLGDLSESLRGELRVNLTKDGEKLEEADFPVELLARAEWGGFGTMGELLPAFVMPNDPAIDKLLKATSDVLRRAGKPDGIDGYEAKSRTRVWELASAMWSAIAGAQISYSLAPASFEAQGQKIRSPSAILEGRVANCLDTALLFAATFEQANLNPLILLTNGHAFVGVWLQPEEFSSLITEDAGAVRKRIDLDEMLVFETTLVTQSPICRFDQAVAEGRRRISEENENQFIMALDVKRARMQRIRPLATDRRLTDAEKLAGELPVSEALTEAPVLPGFDVEASDDLITPADRVHNWQRKLLDLTTRNRLLHVPENAKVVRLVCPDPAELEDRLAAGRKIKISALPDLEAGGRDAKLYQQQTAENLTEQYAREALERGEVVSPVEKSKLEATLIELYRKARSDLEEGGANTLFLALGFLRWKKSADDPKQYRAPLILLPIKLERKSAVSGVTLVAHEDEPRFNLTLLELLRHDFELNIPGLEGQLPTDHSGIDVSKIWSDVRRAVRDLSGFEVTHDVLIGTFSFAKYLMWRDLIDRQEQLKNSPVVRHLIERASNEFRSGGDFPHVDELDRKLDPAELFTPLPADSSQIAAVVASAKGCDFVLDGPPGTGKSQTIANIIAQNLANGLRVLFVAEKRAALDVVYRRLEEKGLGDFCLELHSNKASKVDVIKQLERAWDARDALSSEEWCREAAEVRRLRDSLNEVVSLLHSQHANGLTLHGAIGRVVRDVDESTPRLDWPKGTIHDVGALANLRDLARRLGLARAGVQSLPSLFAGIRQTHWTNAWQESLGAAASSLPKQIDTLNAAAHRLLQATKLALTISDGNSAAAVCDLVTLILRTHGRDFRFAFAPDFTAKFEAARRALSLTDTYRQQENGLSVEYAPEVARRLDLARLDAELVTANAKFWFLATIARRRLTRSLAQQGGATQLPIIEDDLPRLHQLRGLLAELDAIGPALSGIPGWSGLSTDADAMSDAIELAQQIRSRIADLADTTDDLVALRRHVGELVVDANELLTPEGVVAISNSRLASAVNEYRSAVEELSKLATTDVAALSLNDQGAVCQSILDYQPKLNAWCNWCRTREEAIGAGLMPLIDMLEKEGVSAERAIELFEAGYARWFAIHLIDEEPKLSELITDVHMDDIEAYRRLEDRLSALSVRYIRAKLCGRIPDKNSVSKKDGYGILKHQLQLQRRHKPVRQLATEMGDAFPALAPCMLMSPLSIAQYLPADHALFDLVIFDEASQIATWDAIGSIARGRQVIIAGDPRQMPPTSFFSRGAGATDDDAATEEDMESILDECLAAGIPQHGLEWHYRSRHESLIAFSNSRYYENRLITFPAPETRESAVSWRKIDGLYAKGSGRTNQIEAEAVVAETVRRLTDPNFTGAGKTLAIVTLNSDQQRLVENLLDEARRKNPRIERYFAEDLTEPVVVKNLETVQGDERDLILLSIGYGPTEPGAPTMSMNFGPLNRDGGWRRLNVAVTRARQEMVLFTSFDPSMIDLNRTSARAVRDLKHFIEFAQKGPRALAAAVQGSVGGSESPFEEAVTRALIRRGWNVVPQIGVSRFRIDIGIVHPDRPGDYLVGVECDGAAYHSAATARDRDKVRASILVGLGWKLLRTWSTDWWVDSEGAADRLHRQIENVLEQSRANVAVAEPTIVFEVTPDPAAAPAKEVMEIVEHPAAPPSALLATINSLAPTPDFVGVTARSIRSTYSATDFSVFHDRIDPSRFYESDYEETLGALIRHVLETEAPISSSLLVNRIRSAHDFKQAGRIIRDRVMAFAKRAHHVDTLGIGEQFVWLDKQSKEDWCVYRVPRTEADIRMIEDIAPEELRAAASDCVSSEPEVEITRQFGIRRLSASARARISKYIS